MPTRVANGATLYYEEYGSGPDVVLSAQNRVTSGPESFLELLAAAGTHVYSIQLRGFGRSSPAAGEPAGGWYRAWAEDVYQFAQSLGLREFVYAGVSHGAGVGWNLAVMHPGVLRAFVGIVGGPHDRSKLRVRGMGMPAVPMFVVPTSDPVRLRRRAAWLQSSGEQENATDHAQINPGMVFPELANNDHSHTLAREAPERLVHEVMLFLKEIGSPQRGGG